MLKNTLDLRVLEQAPLTFRYWPNGTVFDITHGNIQVNLQKGNPIDGSLANLYLRFHDDYRSITLLSGPHLKKVTWGNDCVVYEGETPEVKYRVTMTLYPHGWTYDVALNTSKPLVCDLYYGQDLGIQDANGILNNEAYIVQYIDFKAFQNDQGTTLCARQNQGQPTYFQMGMREETVGFCTDAMQFFTPKHKIDGHIHALKQPLLANEVYQYEASYLTLQSAPITVTLEGCEVQFYAYVQAHHPEAITAPQIVHFEPKKNGAKTVERLTPHPLAQAPLLSGKPLSEDEINHYYPNRLYEERQDGALLSWFCDDHTHVMTLQKEALLERSQGHIVIQGDILEASSEVLSTTAFMPGIFMSHLTLGNTSFHKFLGDHRHPLMLHRMAGLRLYLQQEAQWHLLATPSLFEVGFQHVTWWYVFPEDTVKITLYGAIDSKQVNLEFTSVRGRSYDVTATLHPVMGSQEWQYDLPLQTHANGFRMTVPQTSMVFEHYPDLTYHFETNVPIALDAMLEGLLVYRLKKASTFIMTVSAAYGEPEIEAITETAVRQQALAFYQNLFEPLSLWEKPQLQAQDVPLIYWYTHNALVHYASPHGLEQYNGAAWGTRDVCQGPFELFSALQMDAQLKRILLTVYGRQFLETGDFPQWFMYDRYRFIQAHESHGDIIFWPLKALAYYLKQTGDLSILEVPVPYFSLEKFQFGDDTPLYAHVQHQIKTMVDHTLHDLPIYGGGDWDDTLQPANQSLKERMVSGWTSALMIQVLEAFAHEIQTYDPPYAQTIIKHAESTKAARHQHMVPQGIPAGFAVFNDTTQYLLHPLDQVTGLSYRLLPLIRSMIAGLTTAEEVKTYTNLIDEHLKFPDGVRLMNAPVLYTGGTNQYFQRAETAANFGREIGLQYVHGHIRYLEAMVVTGQIDKAIEALKMIHPIDYHLNVPNAYPRQRNTYFSSSDGCFLNRYEATEQFDRLKIGSVSVKGGWRIYSSGPGILLHQIIVGLCGVGRSF
jgi:cellobiose phosphorylase